MSDLKSYLKNTDFERRLQNIIEATRKIWDKPVHRHYTDHGIDHSERIIEKLNKLAEELMSSSKPLDTYSIFILLASAYLHDIGMQYEKYGDLERIREEHHLLSAEMIIGSVREPQEYPELGVEREDAERLALVVKGHSSKVDLNSKEYNERPIGSYSVPFGLLAGLLRFADALDVDRRRVNLELLKIQEIPLRSKLEWWLHHYVIGVKIKERVIQPSFEIPSKNYERYEKYIPKIVVDRLREEYSSVDEILRLHGIAITIERQEQVQVFSSELVEEMDNELFNYMLDYLGIREQSFIDLIEKAISDHITLGNFPEEFSPLVVIPGDVREEEPSCAQDLLADTASTSDLAWIPKLNLPEDTILLPDKIASRVELEGFLRDKNLLIIGSPGVNWLSRYIWRKGPFYFVVSEGKIKEAQNRENEIKGLSAREIKKYKEDEKENLKGLILKLKGDGLYEPFRGEISHQPDEFRTRGVISLCKHPFSEDKYAILAGGPRLLGTMAAEKMLTDKEGLKQRPFGGIIEARKAEDKPEGLKFMEADVSWITKEYTPKELRETLEKQLEKELAK